MTTSDMLISYWSSDVCSSDRNQQPAHGTDVAEVPMFDLDRLQGLAVKAAACLAENTRLRRAGQPPGDVQPLEDYMKAAPPNVVLLALDRLAVATGLLEAVKGGVSDPALPTSIDAFLTGADRNSVATGTRRST